MNTNIDQISRECAEEHRRISSARGGLTIEESVSILAKHFAPLVEELEKRHKICTVELDAEQRRSLEIFDRESAVIKERNQLRAELDGYKKLFADYDGGADGLALHLSANEQLRAALKDATEYCECAYCHARILKNHLHVLEHMEVCEKHPVAKLRSDNQRLKEQLDHALTPHRKCADDLLAAQLDNKRLREAVQSWAHGCPCSCSECETLIEALNPK